MLTSLKPEHQSNGSQLGDATGKQASKTCEMLQKTHELKKISLTNLSVSQRASLVCFYFIRKLGAPQHKEKSLIPVLAMLS
jgi:hypothetical protein